MEKTIKVVEERWTFIESYVRNKNVLDVGCAELVITSENPGKRERWLFEKIRKTGKELVGLDINQEQVDILKSLGYNVILGDVETIDLHRQFDVIVAGELIEHLSNPGLFLENMKKHLKDDGFLVLTTPNRFNFIEYFKSFLHNKIPKYEKKIASHVFYFDINTLLALTQRHGFEAVDWCYYLTFGINYDAFKRRCLFKIIAKLRPQFALGIAAAFKKSSV